MRFAIGESAGNRGAHTRRDFRVQAVDIEAHVEMGVVIHVLQGELHDLPDAHLVDATHVEHVEILFVHEASLPRVHTANADLPHPSRTDRRRRTADLQQLARTEPAQARHGHAVQTAGRAEFTRIEIGMRIQPQHAQRPTHAAAMARDRRDRADAQRVVAAEQNGQPLFGQLPIHRIVHLMIPRRDLCKIAIAVHLDQPGIRRTADVAAIHHVEATLSQRRMDAGDPQRLRTHGRTAIARADIRGRTDETGGRRSGSHHANLRRRTRPRSCAWS